MSHMCRLILFGNACQCYDSLWSSPLLTNVRERLQPFFPEKFCHFCALSFCSLLFSFFRPARALKTDDRRFWGRKLVFPLR